MLFPAALAIPLDLVPTRLMEQVAHLMLQRLLAAHPGLFERLDEHREKRFAFAPSDLPLTFVVEPSRRRISIRRGACPQIADATVRGPIVVLLSLLEGQCDADALFFSRDLSVTGDMEAMLALRNALDDCEIDLPRDLSALGGPFAPVLGRMANALRQRALKPEAGAWN